MPKNTLLSLTLAALPKSFKENRLRQSVSQELWDADEYVALFQALSQCQDIDWQGYASQYPAAHANPVGHFLDDGVFEGHRLTLKEHSRQDSATGERQPRISLIILANNDLFLESTIRNVMAQPLEEKEIIVVGFDPQQDALLSEILEINPELKIIPAACPLTPHMARKSGVNAATGDYLMFIDSGDRLAVNACPIALDYAGSCYDMVCFDAYFNFAEHVPAGQMSEREAKENRGNKEEFGAGVILRAIFDDALVPVRIWGKIYRTALCKAAFVEMANDVVGLHTQLYETFVLASFSAEILQIKEKLYVRQEGFVDLRAKEIAAVDTGPGKVWNELETFMAQRGYAVHRDKLFWEFVRDYAEYWLKEANRENCFSLFDYMAGQFGIVNILEYFIRNYAGKWQAVAEKFQYYGQTQPGLEQVHSVGMLYSYMNDGGAERVCWELAPLLIAAGYKVTVFLECSSKNDVRFKPPVEVVYLGGSRNNFVISCLRGLDLMLKQRKIDVMLCHACYDENMLWQTMLLKYARVPVILFTHSSFFRRLMHPGDPYDLRTHAAIMRCGDKAAVLSRYEELYYRICGVDAQYIANPVRLPQKNWQCPDFAGRKNRLIAFGRLGEANKNINDCLYILSEVAKAIPLIQMTFVGSFADSKAKQNFWQLAKKLQILDRIQVTGWIEDPTSFIDQAAILVSTAWHETFPLTISESQGRGIPVVMYDLPIAPAEDNEAIIRVAHGDIKGAVAEIVLLLGDEARWRTLSQTARAKMRQFDSQCYRERMQDLLRTFARQSPLTAYRQKDYETVMRTLGFYSGDIPPWV